MQNSIKERAYMFYVGIWGHSLILVSEEEGAEFSLASPCTEEASTWEPALAGGRGTQQTPEWSDLGCVGHGMHTPEPTPVGT